VGEGLALSGASRRRGSGERSDRRWPCLTLAVNVTGCLLLGLLIGVTRTAARGSSSGSDSWPALAA